jgi:hypothetical protein
MSNLQRSGYARRVSRRRVWLVRLLALALGAACTATVPARLCERRAGAYLRGDLEAQRALALGARDWLDADPDALAFHTGSARFDGEWYLIVHMAAALGFGQTALEHPELRAEHAPLVERAADRILLPRGRAHDVDAWSEDPLATLDAPPERAHGHLAFLGYANLALSMERRLGGGAPHAALNDAMTEALVRRFAASPTALLESYPGETYPADNAAAIASIALHDRAMGADHHAVVERFLATLRARCTDGASGLLYQRVDSASGAPRDGARASGTAMAAFVLGYAGPDAASPWWPALARQWDTVLGFGGVREYPPGAAGQGDVDSGPVLLGLGVSATAFGIASARRAGDAARFRSAFASAWLFGLPDERDGALRWAAGGALGSVLLFAVLTARVAS